VPRNTFDYDGREHTGFFDRVVCVDKEDGVQEVHALAMGSCRVTSTRPRQNGQRLNKT
jgi:hypothetical protein